MQISMWTQDPFLNQSETCERLNKNDPNKFPLVKEPTQPKLKLRVETPRYVTYSNTPPHTRAL